MPPGTTLYVDGLTFDFLRCDWRTGRVWCQTQRPRDDTRLGPLWQSAHQRTLQTYRVQPSPFDSRLNKPLSFMAYVQDWRCEEVAPDVLEHTLILLMDGLPVCDRPPSIASDAGRGALRLSTPANEKEG